ncbi:MAG TPA: S9 family peptidase [Actinomycetes bacterium]|jgi:dipeptidyl aminopeptidase/acylaminoacyl peptidase|nr:S9 family peptidase [Actinomycetes bacterium]
MRPSDLALLRIPSMPALSPDGHLTAVALTRLDLHADAYRSEIWVVPTDGSAAPRRFTGGPRDQRPRFSPDGRWLAFLRAGERDGARPQLHVMPVDGGEPRHVCEHPLGVETLAWSPDSTRIAYVARVPEPGRYGTDEEVPPSKEPPRRITTLKFRLDNTGFTVDRRQHLFVVDALAEEPQPVRLTHGDFDHGDPAWSPDGRLLAFVSARHADRDFDELSDVFVAPAEGGDAVQVTRTTVPASRPAFSPDGGTIWFAAAQTEEAGRNAGLWSVPADGSAPPRRLTDAERWDVNDFLAGGALELLVDDDAVTTITLARGAVHLYRFPSDGGEPTCLLGGRRQVLDYARAAGVIAAVVGDDATMGEVVVLRDGREVTVTDFGSLLARSTSLRPMVELSTSAPDAYPVHGWVVKPAGRGPFPVLLMIHGGPFTQYGYRLFDEAQIYAGAGYAVVMGNPRGSSGYGEAHGRAIVFDNGNLDSADVLALLDAALTDPDLDGDRVGVLGGSYGGFMTSWLVGHTDRFRAAISERAVNAFDSFEGSSDIGAKFLELYVGTEAEQVKVQSPLTYADKIDTPMLLIHSEEDWRCPLEQAQRLFVALKRRRAEVEMLVFPGESHELSRSGLPSHRVARFQAILDWWHRHLDGAAT